MALGSAGSVFVDIEGDLTKLAASLQQAIPESARQGTAAGEAFTKAFSQSTGDVGYFDNIKVAFGNLKTAMGDAFAAIPQYRKDLDALGADLTGIGTGLTIGLTAPLVAFAAAAIKSFSDIDSLKRGLVAVTGSAAEAEKQFADLIEVSKLPGIGIEEAVQGSTRLQAFGFSAKEARDALLAFGNAVATVGGGKAELDRVIIQLGQMAGAGKVLNQDLRPIIQTVPQVAEIIKREFGPEVIGKPAETLAKLGISSRQFIDILIQQLLRATPVVGGIKNDLENFAQAVKLSLASVGESIAPIVHELTERATPALSSMVSSFKALSPEAQRTSIELAGVAAAAGPAFLALGTLSKGTSDILGLMQRLGDKDSGLRAVAVGLGEIGLAAAVIHFTGLDSAAMDLWHALDHSWAKVADEFQQLADATGIYLKYTIGLKGASVDTAGLFDTLRSIAGLKFDNLFTLEGVTGRLFPLFKGLADTLKQSAAGWEVLNGTYKTMEEALAGGALAFENVRKIVDENAKAYQGADSSAREHLKTLGAVVPSLETAAQKQARYTEELKQYHEQLKLINGFSLKEVEAMAEKFGGVAQEIARATAAGIDYTQRSLPFIEAIVKIKDENVKANTAFEASIEIYRQLVDQQSKGSAGADDVAVALAEVYRAAAKAHPELRNNADALDALVRKGTGGAQILKSVADALSELANISIKTKNDLEVWTDVVKQLAPLQGTAAADSQKWAISMDRLRSSFNAMHPEAADLDAAFRQFISDQGISTQATSGMIVVMKNGIPVIEEIAGGTRRAGEAASDAASRTRDYGRAWSEAAIELRNADGDLIAITHDLNTAATAAKNTAAAVKGLGAIGSSTNPGGLGAQGESLAGAGPQSGIKLAAAGASYAAMGLLYSTPTGPAGGAVAVAGQNSIGPNAVAQFEYAMYVLENGEESFGRIVKQHGVWMTEEEAATLRVAQAAQTATPAINQFGESMDGVGDAARKADTEAKGAGASMRTQGTALSGNLEQLAQDLATTGHAITEGLSEKDIQAISQRAGELSSLGHAATEVGTAATYARPALSDLGTAIQGTVEAAGDAGGVMRDATGAFMMSFDAATGIEKWTDVAGKVHTAMHAMMNATEAWSNSLSQTGANVLTMTGMLMNAAAASGRTLNYLDAYQAAWMRMNDPRLTDPAIDLHVGPVSGPAGTVAMPAIPSGGGQFSSFQPGNSGTVSGAGGLSPNAVTVNLNVNGGTFSSNKFVDEVMTQVTDRFRLQLQQHL